MSSKDQSARIRELEAQLKAAKDDAARWHETAQILRTELDDARKSIAEMKRTIYQAVVAWTRASVS